MTEENDTGYLGQMASFLECSVEDILGVAIGVGVSPVTYDTIYLRERGAEIIEKASEKLTMKEFMFLKEIETRLILFNEINGIKDPIKFYSLDINAEIIGQFIAEERALLIEKHQGPTGLIAVLRRIDIERSPALKRMLDANPGHRTFISYAD